MLAGLVKNATLVALLAVALAASTPAVDAAGLTYPKCPEGGEGCCAFGSGKMKSPGYAVVRIEVDTIITCHQGDLKCFAGNPNLRAGVEGRDEIDCPDFSALEESRSEIEYLDGVKTSTSSTTTTTSSEGPGAVHPSSLRFPTRRKCNNPPHEMPNMRPRKCRKLAYELRSEEAQEVLKKENEEDERKRADENEEEASRETTKKEPEKQSLMCRQNVYDDHLAENESTSKYSQASRRLSRRSAENNSQSSQLPLSAWNPNQKGNLPPRKAQDRVIRVGYVRGEEESVTAREGGREKSSDPFVTVDRHFPIRSLSLSLKHQQQHRYSTDRMALFVWGSNASQQLGLGVDDKELYDVRKVEALNGQLVVGFSAGENHSLAVNEFGDVFAWGRGKEGQLGLGYRQDQLVRTPQRVAGLEGHMIKKVSCGEMHSLALSVSGQVFMWGLLPETRQVRNDGMFDHASVSLTGLSQEAMSPRALRDNMAGNIMSRLMRDSELVYESANMVDGENETMQDLGQQKVQTVRHPCFVPRPCPSLAKVIIINIAAGFAHSLASSSCGAVFSCGYNDNGQLGTGSRRNSADFQRVKALEGYFIEHIACGQQHSLACSRIEIARETQQKSGVCFSWGLGILGQLGSGINISWLPMRVEITEPVVSVAAGSHHSVAVTDVGHVYSWGHSEYGQHGAGEMFYDLQRGSHYFFPRVQESLKVQGVCVKRVACSSHSTFALASDGNVYSWGWNAFGVLGVGKYQHSVHPQKLFGLKDNTATHVGAGSNHGAAVVKPRGCHYSLRYDQVLKNCEFADLEFVVNGGKARESAHKVVVCARSGYLKGLLRVIAMSSSFVDLSTASHSDGGNNEESKVLVVDEFKDVDGQVFRSFLGYLYTNRVEIPSHKRKALADFAVRVCHDDLADECQDMWRKRRPTNAGELDEVRQFGNDMQSMVLASEFSDVKFLWPIHDADEEETKDSEYTEVVKQTARFERLPAHKAVLSQVDYFRTMFTGGFSEGASYINSSSSSRNTAGDGGRVMHEIELNYMHRDGVSLEAFKNLLLWIYTGSFERLKDLEPNEMMDLYVGASLIGLNYLASLCELQLAAILAYLDTDSITACLDFAERFDARRLKTLSRQLLEKKKQEEEDQD